MYSTSRRSFLKVAGAVAASAAAPQLRARRPKVPIGLQLYSVRDQLPKDFAGTLAQVHGAGYSVVEAAGYFDRTAPDFRRAMEAAGLRCVSTHHPLSLLETQLDQWIDYGHTLRPRVHGLLVVRRHAPQSLDKGNSQRSTTGTGLLMSSTALRAR